MEVEAVTHALYWIISRDDNQTAHAIIFSDPVSLLQKVKSGMHGMARHPLSETLADVLRWTCQNKVK